MFRALAGPSRRRLLDSLNARSGQTLRELCANMHGELAKLTVIHDDFQPGSAVLETISQGWPHILSNLKTLLETGATLPASPADTAPALVTGRNSGA